MNRLRKLGVVSAVLLLAACTDSTGPEPVDSGKGKAAPAVVELGLWVQDATLWATVGLDDPVNRGQLESSIKALAGHLTAGKTDEIKSDIAYIRALINSGSMDEIVAMGPIEVALDTIDDAMAQ